MNELDYKKFYDKVGRLIGWDFSKLKYETEGALWEFYEEVIERCKPSDVLLDIGTGGGENVLKIASAASSIMGIDNSSGMIEMAQSNLEKACVSNVQFFKMDSEDLRFPNDFFDIVSCCHAPFMATEVARVIKNGGVFLTQQVNERDKWNLKEAFGRGQCLGEKDGTLKEKYVRELKYADFHDVQILEYDAIDYYQTPEDLIFLLKYTPIIPRFGEEKDDFDILEKFIITNKTEKGIRTNSKRFMIVAYKS
ncbi:class I SAM-dependent methyltransferase [Bacillus bingmayongensis]|uniref:class I SAM-dependent methyltransferase n=1 Tax=Bacillus bingmayongensis TaxID=1150157 RepID=UPI0003114F1C|nr:class I SAM-dependent methyltransferase [Bacillus bingmayongensis]MBY0595844.1 class I SAM-dependent methyltransferase [Bacillus bingmayongensis]